MESSTDPRHQWHEMTVSRVIRETSDACSLVFDVPVELAEVFSYRAGQFLTLRVPWQDGSLDRCYSLASSPDSDPEHKVTIKRVEDGRVSNWLNENVAEGDVLRVLPPAGHFHLGHGGAGSDGGGESDLFLFAGGSGITPVISILKTALVTGSCRVSMLYANRDHDSVIFDAELALLESRYGDRFDLQRRYDDSDGFLGLAGVRALSAGNGDREFFVCGPGPFMEVVEQGLRDELVPVEQVHVEHFVSPPDVDDEELAREREKAAEQAREQAADSGEVIKVVVVIDGREHELEPEPGQTVVAAAEAAGISVPFSCTEGYCACCMAQLVEGEVKMLRNDVLTPAEVEDGWVLTCQAVALGGRVRVEYPD
jgi:3-ketosteroid 9alpha-monooxygenase subunit B